MTTIPFLKQEIDHLSECFALMEEADGSFHPFADEDDDDSQPAGAASADEAGGTESSPLQHLVSLMRIFHPR